jgi:hypothetical protein
VVVEAELLVLTALLLAVLVVAVLDTAEVLHRAQREHQVKVLRVVMAQVALLHITALAVVVVQVL